MPRLLIQNPPTGSPDQFPLPQQGASLGRETDNQLVLIEPSVSRHHATLRYQDQAWWVEDSGSSNGTFINDQRIQRATLHPGDRLRVGDIKMVFEADPSTAPPSTAPPTTSPSTSPRPRRGWCGFLAAGCLAVLLLGAAGTWWAWGWVRAQLNRVTQTAVPAAQVAAVPLQPAATVLPPPRVLGDPGEVLPSVTPLAKLPKPLPAGIEALTIHEVGKAGPRRLERAVVLEFPYDPARLPKGVDPEDRLALAHLDEQSGRWILAAAQVNTARQVLRVRTRHLSTWSTLYISLGWRVHRARRFNIVYSPGETIVYGAIKGRSGLVDAFDFAKILGRNLDLALDHYEQAGFRLPEGDSAEDGRVWAFLGHATAYWGGEEATESQWTIFSGNLLFPSNYDTPRQAEHDAAHELFHKIQNLDLNLFSMSQRRWWIEASADYAAARVALQQGGTDTTMGERIRPRYLEKSISFCLPKDDGKQPNSFHDYSTSHFLDYLVKQGADFKALYDAEMHPSILDLMDALDPMDKYLRQTFGASRGLDSFYRDFARFFVLEPASPMPALKAGFFEEVPSAKLSLAAGTRQGTLKGTAEALHAAQVFTVRAEPIQGQARRKLQITQTPGTGTGIIASVHKVKPGAKVAVASHSPLGMLGPKALVTELGPDELIVILACNSTSSDRAVGVEVKDLSPEAVKPPPPPPPTTRKRQLRVTGFAWVSWDQVVQYDGIAWGSRWLEWGTQSYDLPIPDGGSFSLKVREARYDMTISAELNASQVVWLKMQGRSIPGMPIKEFWEFELRGLPVVPGDPTLYQAAASPLVSVVPKDVARFVTKATYERVFPDGTRQVLSNANWNHRTGPWATLPESPNAQCSFVSVKIQ